MTTAVRTQVCGLNETVKEGWHSHSQSPVTTDGQSVGLSWCRAPSGAHDQILHFSVKVIVLSIACALSDGRSGLSFVAVSRSKSVYTRNMMQHICKNLSINSLYRIFTRPLSVQADYALLLVAFATTAVLDS
jgi:hypothetical protein